MQSLKNLEVWFITGSQHLYGEAVLKQVEQHSSVVALALNDSAAIAVQIKYKAVLTTPDAITQLCLEANSAANCIGLIAWMYTFSPAKMRTHGV